MNAQRNTSFQPNAQGRQGSTPREQAALKFKPDYQIQMDVSESKKIGPWGTIVFATSGFAKSYTLHHPIGVTKLTPKSFVLTPTTEVAELITRSVDPEGPENKVKKDKIINDYLIDQKILELKGDKICYPSDSGGEERKKRISECEKKLGEQRAAEKSEHDAAAAKATRRLPKFKFNKEWREYLTDREREVEKKISEAKKSEDLRKKIKEQVPENFETKGGPNMDRPQEPLNLKSGGMETALDEISRALMQCTSSKYIVREATAKEIDAAEEIKTLRESLGNLRDRVKELESEADEARALSEEKDKLVIELNLAKSLLGEKDALEEKWKALSAADLDKAGIGKQMLDQLSEIDTGALKL